MLEIVGWSGTGRHDRGEVEHREAGQRQHELSAVSCAKRACCRCYLASSHLSSRLIIVLTITITITFASEVQTPPGED